MAYGFRDTNPFIDLLKHYSAERLERDRMKADEKRFGMSHTLDKRRLSLAELTQQQNHQLKEDNISIQQQLADIKQELAGYTGDQTEANIEHQKEEIRLHGLGLEQKDDHFTQKLAHQGNVLALDKQKHGDNLGFSYTKLASHNKNATDDREAKLAMHGAEMLFKNKSHDQNYVIAKQDAKTRETSVNNNFVLGTTSNNIAQQNADTQTTSVNNTHTRGMASLTQQGQHFIQEMLYKNRGLDHKIKDDDRNYVFREDVHDDKMEYQYDALEQAKDIHDDNFGLAEDEFGLKKKQFKNYVTQQKWQNRFDDKKFKHTKSIDIGNLNNQTQRTQNDTTRAGVSVAANKREQENHDLSMTQEQLAHEGRKANYDRVHGELTSAVNNATAQRQKFGEALKAVVGSVSYSGNDTGVKIEDDTILGGVKLSVTTRDGDSLPLTANPADDKSPQIKISNEQIPAVEKHLQTTMATLNQSQLTMDDKKAYLRASLFTNPETGETRVATPDEMANNLKSQGFMNRDQSKPFQVNKTTTVADVINAKESQKSAAVRGASRYLKMGVEKATTALSASKSDLDVLRGMSGLYFAGKKTEQQLQNMIDTRDENVSQYEAGRHFIQDSLDAAKTDAYISERLANVRKIKAETSSLFGTKNTDFTPSEIKALSTTYSTDIKDVIGGFIKPMEGQALTEAVTQKYGQIKPVLAGILADRSLNKLDLTSPSTVAMMLGSVEQLVRNGGDADMLPYYFNSAVAQQKRFVAENLRGINDKLATQKRGVSSLQLTREFNAYSEHILKDEIEGELDQRQMEILVSGFYKKHFD